MRAYRMLPMVDIIQFSYVMLHLYGKKQKWKPRIWTWEKFFKFKMSGPDSRLQDPPTPRSEYEQYWKFFFIQIQGPYNCWSEKYASRLRWWIDWVKLMLQLTSLLWLWIALAKLMLQGASQALPIYLCQTFLSLCYV